jgi:hypothetical protein
LSAEKVIEDNNSDALITLIAIPTALFIVWLIYAISARIKDAESRKK